MPLTKTEQIYWDNYLRSSSQENMADAFFVEAFPAGNFETTDKLIALYKQGKKTAGSSAVEDYDLTGDPLPQVGNFWIVLDGQKSPAILLKTVRTEVHLFNDVPLSVAIAEGEADLSLESWREIHSRFFGPFLKNWAVADVSELHILTEHFELQPFGEE